jgi:hypothetical protein
MLNTPSLLNRKVSLTVFWSMPSHVELRQSAVLLVVSLLTSPDLTVFEGSSILVVGSNLLGPAFN